MAVFCESENSGDRQVRAVFMKIGFSGQDREVSLPREFRCQFYNRKASKTEVALAADVSPAELFRRFFKRTDVRSKSCIRRVAESRREVWFPIA
jgi:hypothetical protein